MWNRAIFSGRTTRCEPGSIVTHFFEVACAGAVGGLTRESGKDRGTTIVGAVWDWKTGTLIIANF